MIRFKANRDCSWYIILALILKETTQQHFRQYRHSVINRRFRNASKYLCSLNPAHLERLCFPGSNDGEMNPILNFVSSLQFVYYHNQHGIDPGETFQYTRDAEQNFWNRAYYFCKKSPLPQKPPPVTNSFIFSSLIK